MVSPLPTLCPLLLLSCASSHSDAQEEGVAGQCLQDGISSSGSLIFSMSVSEYKVDGRWSKSETLLGLWSEGMRGLGLGMTS